MRRVHHQTRGATITAKAHPPRATLRVMPRGKQKNKNKKKSVYAMLIYKLFVYDAVLGERVRDWFRSAYKYESFHSPGSLPRFSHWDQPVTHGRVDFDPSVSKEEPCFPTRVSETHVSCNVKIFRDCFPM